MASTKDYLEYVLELLSDIDTIEYKKMMGEYLLYKNKKLFGGIYDNRFLIKESKSIEEYQLAEEIPYPGAKAMYLIDIEDKKLINTIIDKLVDNIWLQYFLICDNIYRLKRKKIWMKELMC